MAQLNCCEMPLRSEKELCKDIIAHINASLSQPESAPGFAAFKKPQTGQSPDLFPVYFSNLFSKVRPELLFRDPVRLPETEEHKLFHLILHGENFRLFPQLFFLRPAVCAPFL